ncbi:sigma-70 family RNA polymerase sigma factor [Embleya sp. NPDC001921]
MSPGRETHERERRIELLMAESTPLRRYVSGILGTDLHTVEDVVQETLLRAWEAADRLDWDGRPIRMWLFRVARNLAVDARRRNRSLPVGIDPSEFVGLPTVPDPAATVVDRCVLVGALRALAPSHREAVAQVHLLDRSGADVARTLGIPRGTVKSRTYHGIAAIRREPAAIEESG